MSSTNKAAASSQPTSASEESSAKTATSGTKKDEHDLAADRFVQQFLKNLSKHDGRAKF